MQVDGRLAWASCLVPAVTAASSEVRTVEGLAADGQPWDVQRALAKCGAVQCGFCVPGMAMTVHDLLEGNPAPTELESRQALCGNLCRCSATAGSWTPSRGRGRTPGAQRGSRRGRAGRGRAAHPAQGETGAGGVNPSAFEDPPSDFQAPHEQPYGQDGGQALAGGTRPRPRLPAPPAPSRCRAGLGVSLPAAEAQDGGHLAVRGRPVGRGPAAGGRAALAAPARAHRVHRHQPRARDARRTGGRGRADVPGSACTAAAARTARCSPPRSYADHGEPIAAVAADHPDTARMAAAGGRHRRVRSTRPGDADPEQAWSDAAPPTAT